MASLRGSVRRAQSDVLAFLLFDPRHYAQSCADPVGGRRASYRSFLTEGWQQGHDPNGWFSCNNYLEANPDVRESGVNPWLHFMRSGRFEERELAVTAAVHSAAASLGPLTLDDSLAAAARTLVDEDFYLAAYPDVAVTGLTATEHFFRYGAAEGRAPAPWFDIEYLSTHSPSYRLGAGNPLTDLLRLTTGVTAEPGPESSFWVDSDAATQVLAPLRDATGVLVVIHAFYSDDLPTFAPYVTRLGEGTTAVITCPANTAERCRQWAASCGLPAVVVETANRGRDWGPLLAVAQETRGARWAAVLKLHTKRSPHRADGREWLLHTLDGLIPDEGTVETVSRLLETGDCDLLCAPGTLSAAQGWRPQGRRNQEFYKRYVDDADELLFPAGSMFWMSARLWDRLGGLALSVGDFDPELGQLDGTLAHALERVVVRVSSTEPALVP